jgi:hypothetical protein
MGNVKIRTNIDFTGDCISYAVEITQCSNFLPAFQVETSSFAPENNLHSIFYSYVLAATDPRSGDGSLLYVCRCQNCNCDNYVYLRRRGARVLRPARRRRRVPERRVLQCQVPTQVSASAPRMTVKSQHAESGHAHRLSPLLSDRRFSPATS